MPVFSRHLCVLCALLALAPSTRAQERRLVDSQAERTLGDRMEQVKANDGRMAERRSTLVYDPVRGEYIKTVYDASGLILDRTVRANLMIGPSPAETATAVRLIRTDPELAALLANAEHPVTVSGGFPLVREEGHACGPGSRCLMYDLFEVVPPASKGARPTPRRIRFVVVDLRAVQLFERNFDPAVEGNFANPAIRAKSRARGSR